MKILIIGLGGIGQRYLRILKKNYKNSIIYSIRSSKKNYEIDDNLKIDKNVDIMKKYQINKINDIKDIKLLQLDFALITSPTGKHLEYLRELISENIPILVEKPLSNSYSKAKKIIDYAHSLNVIILTAYVLRFHPAVKKLKKLLDKNILGKIQSVSIDIFSFMPGWHKYEKYESLYASKKELGGGVLLTESHELDLLVWLFGMPNRAMSFSNKTSSYNINVEDTAVSIMEYKDKYKNFLVSINQCFTSKLIKRSIYFYGEKGSLELNFVENSIYYDNLRNKKKIFSLKVFKRNSLFLNQIKYFNNLIGNKIKRNDLVLDNGLDTLNLIEMLKNNNK